MDTALERVRQRLKIAEDRHFRRAVRYGRRADRIPIDDLLSVLQNKQGYRCAYCPVRIIFDFTMDHKIPLVAGGHHFLANIQFTCRACNSSKHHRIRPRYRPYVDPDYRVPFPVAATDPGEPGIY